MTKSEIIDPTAEEIATWSRTEQGRRHIEQIRLNRARIRRMDETGVDLVTEGFANFTFSRQTCNRMIHAATADLLELLGQKPTPRRRAFVLSLLDGSDAEERRAA